MKVNLFSLRLFILIFVLASFGNLLCMTDTKKPLVIAIKVVGFDEENHCVFEWSDDYNLNESESEELIFNVQQGDLGEVSRLLEIGADVNQTDEYGQSALWWAAEKGFYHIALILIDAGAIVDKTSDLGGTPLHIAANEGNKKLVKLLLEKGSDPNSLESEYGNTPMHEAARGECWLYPSKSPEYRHCYIKRLQDYKDVIELLIRYGASNDILNYSNQKPSELALIQQKEFYPELGDDSILKKHIELLSK